MDYYDSIAKGYDELHYEEQLKKYRVVKEKLKIKKSDNLLDVACGTGIARIFSCDVTGVDSSAGILKRCKGVRKILASAEKLPFPDRSFDIVTCITAIHNFDDVSRAVKEMKRVSRGAVVISVLRKAGNYGKIIAVIKKSFILDKMVEEERDTILFLHNKL